MTYREKEDLWEIIRELEDAQISRTLAAASLRRWLTTYEKRKERN